MKQTNYQLYDFLDFDPEMGEDYPKRLWRAGRPLSIDKHGLGVRIVLPFHCQVLSHDIQADPSVEIREYAFIIRAYGDNILRLITELGAQAQESSPMLDMAEDLVETSLDFEKSNEEWLIKDRSGKKRALIQLSEPEIDWWSDLLPAPEPGFQVSFFPDGKRELRLSAADQFFPARVDAMGLAMISEEGQAKQLTMSFEVGAEECFAGTGERFAKMDLAGRTFQLKNQDGQGVNSRRTYKNIPFFLSSKGYGIFMHSSAYGKISLADHSSRSAQLMVEEPLMDLFLIGADQPSEILRHYRRITGFPSLPPLWSFGLWMSRMTYFSAEEVEEICQRLRRENFPCDVIHLDTGWFRTDWLCEWKFNPERFPDPRGFIKTLKQQGFRLSLWQMPYIAAEAEQHEEAKKNNYIAPLKKNKTQGGSNFSALDYAGTIDFTSPEATEWYKGLLRQLLEMGVACIKADFGEEIHMEADYAGLPAEQLNNLYALLYQRAAYEVTREMNGEGLIWARAGWAGCQRYPVHWGGDAAASWEGMAGSLRGGLHLGMSGFAFWSHDVPGFHGLPNFMNSIIPDDLYLRWTQFGVFSSHIRYHGTAKREPYHYPEIADLIRKWWQLRYQLIPYILDQSEKSIHSGMPLLRAMALHHAEDHCCWHLDDQYYFGDELIIAPVMNSDHSRKVYLPEGTWVHFFTGQRQEGPLWLKLEGIPLGEMPVWIKEGVTIPVYNGEVSCTDDMDLAHTDRLSIDGEFRGIWK